MTAPTQYPVGSLPAAALTILGPPLGRLGPVPLPTREQRYAVRYDCCGRHATLTHRSLAKRIAQGLRTCQPCGRLASRAARLTAGGAVLTADRAWGYYPEGAPLAEGGVTIQLLAVAGTTQATTWYQVRHDCCGRDDLLSHAALRERQRRGHQRCGSCGRAAGGSAGGARRHQEAAARQTAARCQQAAADARALLARTLAPDTRDRAWGDYPEDAREALFDPAVAWPRPASLRGQPPWWPGARPGPYATATPYPLSIGDRP